MRSDQAGRGGQRELRVGEPAGSPSRAPSAPTATQPITTKSTGDRPAGATRRAELAAPLIEAAFRAGSLR
jgi:hypothetical protein